MNKEQVAKACNKTAWIGWLTWFIVVLIYQTGKVSWIPKKLVASIAGGSILVAVIGALISGVVGARGMPVEKGKNPILYWLLVLVYSVVAVLFLGAVIQG